MFCYVETDYMIAGPPMSFGMMKGNNKMILCLGEPRQSRQMITSLLRDLW